MIQNLLQLEIYSNFAPQNITIMNTTDQKEYYDKYFGLIAGKQLTMPTEYLPSREFLEYHYECIFQR